MLKNREPFSSTLQPNLKAGFLKLAEDTRIAQTKLLDEAIEDLLKKHAQQKSPK